MEIYAVIKEIYENETFVDYLIEKVFTSYKKAEYYKRYSQAWIENNHLNTYVWKYTIKRLTPDTYNYEKMAIIEENKRSR